MEIQKLDLVDLVRELTQPIIHREHYGITVFHRDGTSNWAGRDHVTIHPPLITQLWQATETGSAQSEGARPGYGSKPTARIDALDTAVQIDLAASRWVRDLGQDDPLDTIGCIRLLGSLMPGQPAVTIKAVTHDVRHWWTWCRILSGWDRPAWKPNSTCPLCTKRGTLRVKLDDQSAMCVDCRETWSRESIGLLAEHIRRENHDTPDQAAS